MPALRRDPSDPRFSARASWRWGLTLAVLACTSTALAGVSSLRMISDPGDWVGAGREYAFTRADGTFGAARVSTRSVSAWFETPDHRTSWFLQFSAPLGLSLVPGVYPNATGSGSTGGPVLSVSGEGRGCSGITGSFEVREILDGPPNGIRTLVVAFEQHCEGRTAALRGEIRYDVPFELLTPRLVSTLETRELITMVSVVSADGTPVALTASLLPTGATFIDRRDGTGELRWTPALGQSGTYPMTFSGQDAGGHVEIATTVLSVGTAIRVPGDYRAIQTAIDAALPGSLIVVDPGVYQEAISFNGKAVSVESVAGPESTILDAGGASPVVVFLGNEGRGSVLRGFTLRNGRSNSRYSDYGGGIYAFRASPTIVNNVIVENHACRGGGIASQFGSPRIEGNVVSRNGPGGCTMGEGGGIYLYGGSAEVVRNLIADNVTYGEGGGISIDGDASTIERNVVRGNVAHGAGGIGATRAWGLRLLGNLIVENSSLLGAGVTISDFSPSYGAAPQLVSNTIAYNDAVQGSAVQTDRSGAPMLTNNVLVAKPGQSALYCEDSGGTGLPDLRHNDVFSLGGSAYAGACSDPSGTAGNVSTDPAFRCPTSGDYRLSRSSPALDAGDGSVPGLPTQDLEGNPRIADGNGDGTPILDLGALELDPAAQNEACDYVICRPDLVQVAPPGSSAAIVDFPLPVVSEGASATCSPTSGSAFPEGSTAVVCTAVYPSGASGTCAFKVNVPPLNDDVDRIERILTLPFSDRCDTRYATAAADDPFCESRFATVWYAFTPAEETVLLASGEGSSYATDISAYTGEPGAFSQVACGGTRVGFLALAGEALRFKVSSRGAGGGDLVFSLSAHPRLTIEITADDSGAIVPTTGEVTVAGTVTCTRSVDVDISVSLLQSRGPEPALGWTTLRLPCDGTTRWSSRVTAARGTFRAGPASAGLELRAVDPITGERIGTQTRSPILLRPVRPTPAGPPDR